MLYTNRVVGCFVSQDLTRSGIWSKTTSFPPARRKTCSSVWRSTVHVKLFASIPSQRRRGHWHWKRLRYESLRCCVRVTDDGQIGVIKNPSNHSWTLKMRRIRRHQVGQVTVSSLRLSSTSEVIAQFTGHDWMIQVDDSEPARIENLPELHNDSEKGQQFRTMLDQTRALKILDVDAMAGRESAELEREWVQVGPRPSTTAFPHQANASVRSASTARSNQMPSSEVLEFLGTGLLQLARVKKSRFGRTAVLNDAGLLRRGARCPNLSSKRCAIIVPTALPIKCSCDDCIDCKSMTIFSRQTSKLTRLGQHERSRLALFVS